MDVNRATEHVTGVVRELAHWKRFFRLLYRARESQRRIQAGILRRDWYRIILFPFKTHQDLSQRCYTMPHYIRMKLEKFRVPSLPLVILLNVSGPRNIKGRLSLYPKSNRSKP